MSTPLDSKKAPHYLIASGPTVLAAWQKLGEMITRQEINMKGHHLIAGVEYPESTEERWVFTLSKP